HASAKAYRQLLLRVPLSSPAASPRSARGRWAGQAAGRRSARAKWKRELARLCSWTWPSLLSPRQPRGKGGVLGSGQALFQDLDQPIQILGVQCRGVKPEAGEYLRAIDAVRPRRQVFKAIGAADKPVDLVGVELHNDIFLDPSPLVIGLLRAQVEGATGAGDLDEQFGCSPDVLSLIDGSLTTQFRWYSELGIRLNLTGPVELDRRVVRTANTSRETHVVA